MQTLSILPKWVQLAQAGGAILGGLIAAAWTVWMWWKRREDAPRLRFTVDINFVARRDAYWLVELVALVENTGLVREVIHEFSFALRTLPKGDLVAEGDAAIGYAVSFPRVIKSGSWIPRSFGDDTLIEPSEQPRYTHIAAVPHDVTVLLLHGRFTYHNGYVHTADKLISVPGSERLLPAAQDYGDSLQERGSRTV